MDIIRNTPDERAHANGRAEQFIRSVIDLARGTPGEICVVFQAKVRDDRTFDYVWDWFWRLPTDEEDISGEDAGQDQDGSGGVPGSSPAGGHTDPRDQAGTATDDE